jgi:hypothetical protein
MVPVVALPDMLPVVPLDPVPVWEPDIEVAICVLLLVWNVIVPEDDSTVKLRPDTLTFVTLPVTVVPESVVRLVEVVVDDPVVERSSVWARALPVTSSPSATAVAATRIVRIFRYLP